MTDEKPKGRATRLRVTACTPVYTGANTRGDQYTIYEVEAQKSDGKMVEEKLRSFENLPLEILDLTVVQYNSEKHGVSYTLSRRSRPNTAAKVKELEDTINDLVTRVEALERASKPRQPFDDPDLQTSFGDIPV